MNELMSYMAIPGVAKPTTMTPKHIMYVVSEFYGLTIDQMVVACRKRQLVEARQVSMYIMRMNTHLTLTQIGRLFGRDHTTVVHAMSNVKVMCQVDHDFKQRLHKIQGLLQ